MDPLSVMIPLSSVPDFLEVVELQENSAALSGPSRKRRLVAKTPLDGAY